MKEKKKKRRQEELPDYTVAHMDVDGMPWNSKRPWQLLPGDPARESRKKSESSICGTNDEWPAGRRKR